MQTLLAIVNSSKPFFINSHHVLQPFVLLIPAYDYRSVSQLYFVTCLITQHIPILCIVLHHIDCRVYSNCFLQLSLKLKILYLGWLIFIKAKKVLTFMFIAEFWAVSGLHWAHSSNGLLPFLQLHGIFI